MLAQALHFGFRIGEVSCPTRYFAEASSINLHRSVTYGFGVLGTAARFALQRVSRRRLPLFRDEISLRLPVNGLPAARTR